MAGENPPIGMILTRGTGGLLVVDVTDGLSRQRLVQKYLLAESGGAVVGVEPDLADEAR